LLLHALTGASAKLWKSLAKKDASYANAVLTYAAFLIDRIAARGTSFGKWHMLQETVEHPFGRQAIQINFDYPEINTFGESSGNAIGQLETIIDFIREECDGLPVSDTHLGSAEQWSFQSELDAVVSDPPYYDAIAYADISDFFYVWLKRVLRATQPGVFALPQTPKADECTALKHHHEDSKEKAKAHFESKLAQSFKNASLQTTKDGIVVIMFAHQSTEAWSTLCNSILTSSMNMTSSWAFDSEVTAALKSNKAYLASSVTVSCRPFQRSGIGSFREVKQAIESTVGIVVHELYTYGFRGADLLTACFGFAVSEFGKYEKVEKASGDEVTVKELLDMAREAAFNAIISDINTDDTTRFYIGWLNLFGFTEAEHDDVRRITQIGLNIDINELLATNIILRNGNKQTLASLEERIGKHPKIGLNNNPLTIDKVHQAMHLFSGARGKLVTYVAKVAPTTDDSFWRVATALAEVLPPGSNDHKLASGLAVNKDSLLRDAKQVTAQEMAQTSLFE
jgi:adenine-specific DNA methylase